MKDGVAATSSSLPHPVFHNHTSEQVAVASKVNRPSYRQKVYAIRSNRKDSDFVEECKPSHLRQIPCPQFACSIATSKGKSALIPSSHICRCGRPASKSPQLRSFSITVATLLDVQSGLSWTTFSSQFSSFSSFHSKSGHRAKKLFQSSRLKLFQSHSIENCGCSDNNRPQSSPLNFHQLHLSAKRGRLHSRKAHSLPFSFFQLHLEDNSGCFLSNKHQSRPDNFCQLQFFKKKDKEQRSRRQSLPDSPAQSIS